jgi:hypothetical protein
MVWTKTPSSVFISGKRGGPETNPLPAPFARIASSQTAKEVY